MSNKLIPCLAILIVLSAGSTNLVKAQDSVKKTVVVKKAMTRPISPVPAAVNAATGKPPVPINPKTGRPYTKYGYGYYSKNRYDATKAAQKADSIQKAAAAKAGVPPPQVAVVPKTDTAAAVPATTDKSLNGQYQYLLSKVYHYQQPLLAAFWKNVNDSLKANKTKLIEAQAKAATQAKMISDLQTKPAEQTENPADEISLFGIMLDKGVYNIIMWGLVGILALAVAIVIYLSGSLRYQANYRTNLYNELEEEFKIYKTKANDKEKKLARELQTERNKIDELLGRG